MVLSFQSAGASEGLKQFTWFVHRVEATQARGSPVLARILFSHSATIEALQLTVARVDPVSLAIDRAFAQSSSITGLLSELETLLLVAKESNVNNGVLEDDEAGRRGPPARLGA